LLYGRHLRQRHSRDANRGRSAVRTTTPAERFSCSHCHCDRRRYLRRSRARRSAIQIRFGFAKRDRPVERAERTAHPLHHFILRLWRFADRNCGPRQVEDDLALPHNNFCGQPVSFAWASDGRRVAFTLDEIGGTSPYPDLHVVDSSRSEMRRFRGLRSGAFRRPKSTGRRTERVSRTAAVGSTC